MVNYEVKVIKVADLMDLSKVVTTPSGMLINVLKNQFKKNIDIEKHLFVADVNGVFYGIDNLEVLIAAKAVGVKELECQVIKANSEKDALRLHLKKSDGLSVNPFQVIDVLEFISDNDNDIKDYVPEPYIKLKNMGFTKEVRAKFSKYMADYGKKHDIIPSAWHVFKPLKSVKKEKQIEAVERTFEYCESMGTFPDEGEMRQLFVTEATKVNKKPKTAEKGKVKEVKVDGTNAGVINDPHSDMIEFACDCKQRWYINKKNATVRKMDTKDGAQIMQGNSGMPVFSIPYEKAKYLGIDAGSGVSYHDLLKDRKKPGDTEVFGSALLVTKSDWIKSGSVKKMTLDKIDTVMKSKECVVIERGNMKEAAWEKLKKMAK